MPDIAGNPGTTATIAVGETRIGALETVFDEDWYRLDLDAGQTVTITLRGAAENGVSDPILDLYDASGHLIDLNLDMSADNLNARITYTATESATFFVDAYASGAVTGQYVLNVSSLANSPVASILWGTQVPTNAITVCFARAGVEVDGITSEGWSADQITRAMQAFGAIEAVTNLTFTRVDDPAKADFLFGLDDDELAVHNLLGYFHPPGEASAGHGNLNGERWDRSALVPGTLTQAILIHEFLHGLGLSHPHDTGGTSTVMDGVAVAFGDYGTAGLNQGIYTTMSYNFGWNEGDWGSFAALSGGWGYQTGPMALDIAALQSMYGANLATADGDDIYDLPDLNQIGTGWRSIWDTGGTDTIQYAGLRDAIIDLRPATLDYGPGGGGFLSAARSVAGGFTIAQGVLIENANTGTGNDVLIGNDANNALMSGRGNDLVRGGGGDDRIIAHRGDDTVDGGDGEDWISAGRGDDAVTGGPGDDSIYAGRGNDRISGGAGNDILWGRKGRDDIDGGTGDDLIMAGPGADRVRGGAGDDTITLGFGADTFVFRQGDGHDTITDFRPARDRLEIGRELVDSVDLVIASAVAEAGGVRIIFDARHKIFLEGDFDLADLVDAVLIGP